LDARRASCAIGTCCTYLSFWASGTSYTIGTCCACLSFWASCSVITLRASGASFTNRAFGTSCSVVALRASRASFTYGTRRAYLSFWASFTYGTCCAYCALNAGSASVALDASGASFTNRSFGAGCSVITLRASGTSYTIGASSTYRSFWAGSTSYTIGTCSTYLSFWAGCSVVALDARRASCAIGTCCTYCALNAGSASVALNTRRASYTLRPGFTSNSVYYSNENRMIIGETCGSSAARADKRYRIRPVCISGATVYMNRRAANLPYLIVCAI
jgi:hypothetical protein